MKKLREALKAKHSKYVNSFYTQLLLSGKISEKMYAEILVNHVLTYGALEKKADEMGLLDNIEDIKRTEAIIRDLNSISVDEDLYIANETKKYCEYIEHVETPRIILAHMYVRHYNLIQGAGQMKKVIPYSGEYYTFDDPEDLKRRLERKLDDGMCEYAEEAFDMIANMFDELHRENMGILDLLKDCTKEITERFDCYSSSVIETGVPEWYNVEYNPDWVDRVHLEVLDELEKHDVYLIHFCIFPHLNDPSPVFGMDFVYSGGKLLGAFHDFSPMGESKMVTHFEETMPNLVADDRRALPSWMSEVSSKAMLSTVTITDSKKVKIIIDQLLRNLDYYIKNVGDWTEHSYEKQLNKYCRHQKKNPHIKQMLYNFGYDKEKVDSFVDQVLFPEK